jgi:AraC-like DNA-binding protein
MAVVSRFIAQAQVITPPVGKVNQLPDGTTAVIFRLLGDGRADLHAVGPRTRVLIKRSYPFRTVLRVVFRPGRGSPFFGVPLGELTDRVVPLSDLWGTSARQLLQKLVEADTDAQRLRELESALKERLHKAEVYELAAAPTVRQALVQLATWPNSCREVARSLNVSERNLRRAFTAVVGLSPKRYARIVRFQKTLARVARGPVRWAEVAVESGYFDQAHMCAEFRELSQTSPTAFLRKHAVQER